MAKREKRTTPRAWRPARTPIQGVRAKLGSLECTVANLSSTGAMLRSRVEAPVGFTLDAIPEPPPIFALIQEKGRVPIEEMYTVFNMGIGFCLIVGPEGVERVLTLLQQAGERPCILGKATGDHDKAVTLTRQKVVGTGHTFEKISSFQSAPASRGAT